MSQVENSYLSDHTSTGQLDHEPCQQKEEVEDQEEDEEESFHDKCEILRKVRSARDCLAREETVSGIIGSQLDENIIQTPDQTEHQHPDPSGKPGGGSRSCCGHLREVQQGQLCQAGGRGLGEVESRQWRVSRALSGAPQVRESL